MSSMNLLLTMTDQFRHDALGCIGGWTRTPALDRLAAGGVCFTNCVTNSPVCVPARLSMATGLYPHNTGVWNNQRLTLDAGRTPTWMRAICDAGWHTALVGKTHLHPHEGDLRDREEVLHAAGMTYLDETPGPRACCRTLSHMTEAWAERGLWDAYQEDYRERFANVPHVVRPSTLPLEHYYDTYVGRQSREHLASLPADSAQPWFIWTSFGGPHEPWDTPEPYASQFDPADMPPPVGYPAATAELPRNNMSAKYKERGALSPAEIAAMRADYAGNVALIDDQIAALLQTVEDRGELDRTVIVFCSDHGEMNGDAEMIYKSLFLDPAVRVPLIVSTPETRAAGGRRCDAPVEWFDVGATLLDYAGQGESWAHARSLRPLVEDPVATHRDGSALSELSGEYLLFTRDWKLAVTKNGEPYLLIDRQADPLEQHNLAGSPAYAAQETLLCAQLMRRLATSPTPFV